MRHIRVFDVLDERRPPVRRAGVPQGARRASRTGFAATWTGNLGRSAGDGVHCVAPDGRLLGSIKVPFTVANLTFGGRNRARLFICASHTLYAIYTNQRGAWHGCPGPDRSSNEDVPMTRRMVAGAVLGLCAALALSGPRRGRHRHRPQPGGVRVRVVVAGGGFGGLEAASHLAGRPGVDLTVIDPTGQHLFQPLLYQVATAALAPEDIVSPLPSVLPGMRVIERAVTGIDAASRRVLTDGLAVPYDTLVLATGSQPSYFGHGEWGETALPLKTLRDAMDVAGQDPRRVRGRGRDGADRARALTFLLVGGGATGVEMAGSIAELAQEMLGQEFHSVQGMQAADHDGGSRRQSAVGLCAGLDCARDTGPAAHGGRGAAGHQGDRGAAGGRHARGRNGARRGR